MRTALILLAGIAALQSAKAEEWQKRWNISGKPELHVSAGDAAVVVESGGGNDAIEATVTTRGWSIGESGVRIIEHQNGNRVDLDIKLPQTHFSWNGNRSIRVEVRVPRELVADIRTGDGSIKLRDLAGVIRADTGDGSIEAERLDGNLDAHSGDGSVRVSGRFDNLQLRTQDGSVDLSVLKGSRVNADWRVQTGDGSVRLRLPQELSANLELHTGDGHISMDLPLTVTSMKSEHGIQGKLNSGGALLLVRTGDGSISVSAS
jgi:DUF4097 and DUF4098 domain-containing protein YvlB